MPTTLEDEMLDKATERESDLIRFLRSLIAIPSESAEEGGVIERAREEATALGFDAVHVDDFGNLIARVGDGPVVVAFDGHIDTVGVGNRDAWTHDPYAGEIEGGKLYGRGTSDQEAGVACAIYGAALAKELGLLEGLTVYVTATVSEEDCDGLCWQHIVEADGLRPDVVVLTEPTDLAVYRGHRGRMEIEIATRGRSAHGSMPERGDNAIYKMAPIIADVERLNETLKTRPDPFLGPGTVVVSDVRSTSPSMCAVADGCTLHLDRRLTLGETEESALAEIRALPSVQKANAEVTVPRYRRPTWTGAVRETEMYYPTWAFEEDHPAVRAAVDAARHVLGEAPAVGRWTFSTNGVSTAGRYGIPSVGFGPGVESMAHAPDEYCPVDHLAKATAFYAAFPQAYKRARAAHHGERS